MMEENLSDSRLWWWNSDRISRLPCLSSWQILFLITDQANRKHQWVIILWYFYWLLFFLFISNTVIHLEFIFNIVHSRNFTHNSSQCSQDNYLASKNIPLWFKMQPCHDGLFYSLAYVFSLHWVIAPSMTVSPYSLGWHVLILGRTSTSISLLFPFHVSGV